MPQLFLIEGKSKADFNQCVWNNRKDLFPQDNFVFIAQRFPLEDDGSGKDFIDILAYNSATDRFVIFELKRGKDGHAVNQSMEYRKRVLKSIEKIHFAATHKYKKKLPPIEQVDQKAVDIIVLAEGFDNDQIKQTKDVPKGNTTLIKYLWFEKDFFFFEYVRVGNWQDTLKNTKSDRFFREVLRTVQPMKRNVDKLEEIVKQAPEMFSPSKRAALWEYIVGSVVIPELKEQLQSIPYTKENAFKLRNIVVLAPPSFRLNKHNFLLTLLKKIDAHD